MWLDRGIPLLDLVRADQAPYTNCPPVLSADPEGLLRPRR